MAEDIRVEETIEREAIRAILLTPDHEVLLLRILPPDGSEAFWIAPGGGREPGETVDETLRRELQEELGLEAASAGPLLWQREHTFTWGSRRIHQREQYHIVHVDRFTPVMTDEQEAQALDCFRWWRAADLVHAAERLTPLSLAQIVARYLAAGAPLELGPVEVLVD